MASVIVENGGTPRWSQQREVIQLARGRKAESTSSTTTALSSAARASHHQLLRKVRFAVDDGL